MQVAESNAGRKDQEDATGRKQMGKLWVCRMKP